MNLGRLKELRNKPALFKALALLSLFAVCPSQGVYGWGQYGHQVIASIAERLIRSETAAEVKRILPEGESLVSVSAWADKVGKKQRETANWHYVNIPKGSEKFEDDRDCPKAGCLVTALENLIEILGEENIPPEKREEALKFVVHLVGDLHQPLHAGYREDRGGNWLQVRFFTRGSNLHKVWDTDLLTRGETGFNEYVDKLIKRIGPDEPDVLMRGTILDWVYESRNLLTDHVYEIPKNRKLGEEYYNKSIVIVDRQLLKAGVRLAGILDRALGPREN